MTRGGSGNGRRRRRSDTKKLQRHRELFRGYSTATDKRQSHSQPGQHHVVETHRSRVNFRSLRRSWGSFCSRDKTSVRRCGHSFSVAHFATVSKSKIRAFGSAYRERATKIQREPSGARSKRSTIRRRCLPNPFYSYRVIAGRRSDSGGTRTIGKGNDAVERHGKIYVSRFTKDEMIKTDLAPGATLPDIDRSPNSRSS